MRMSISAWRGVFKIACIMLAMAVLAGAGWCALAGPAGREAFASSWMMTLQLDDSTSYHPDEAAIVAADPYLRSITSGGHTGYSTLAAPKYAGLDAATGAQVAATDYAGLPASATYSSSGAAYVPDYTDAIALSRTRA